MRQLSGLDAAFLSLETSNSTGHVGSISILDPSEMDEPFDLAHLMDMLEGRLGKIPLLRRRLKDVPLGLDHPFWVDDVDFDLEFHVREVGLPAPGSQKQLMDQICRLHARALDRNRPLWEIYLISGIEGGKVAVYIKIHHAMIDGASGVELLNVLIDLSPKPDKKDDLVPFKPRKEPSSRQLLVKGVLGLASRPVDAVRIVGNIVKFAPSVSKALTPFAQLLRKNTGTDGEIIQTANNRPPETPFNGHISAHRRLGISQCNLDDVKKVKNTFGTSVNDVVLAMSAGALRRWLEERAALPTEPLITMIPVSVRDESQRNAMGNKVSAMFTPLPTNIKDPVKRLLACNETTQVAKASQAAIPPGLIDNVTNFAPPLLMARAARVAFETGLIGRLYPSNLVISNVPGPDIQAYMGGAKLEAIYPVSVILDGQGLNITVQGYRGKLNFGLLADREMVPDVDRLANFLINELNLLIEAADKKIAAEEKKTATARAKRTPAKRSPVKSAAEKKPSTTA